MHLSAPDLADLSSRLDRRGLSDWAREFRDVAPEEGLGEFIGSPSDLANDPFAFQFLYGARSGRRRATAAINRLSVGNPGRSDARALRLVQAATHLIKTGPQSVEGSCLARRTRASGSRATFVFPVCRGPRTTTELPCSKVRINNSHSIASRSTRSSALTAPPVGNVRLVLPISRLQYTLSV